MNKSVRNKKALLLTLALVQQVHCSPIPTNSSPKQQVMIDPSESIYSCSSTMVSPTEASTLEKEIHHCYSTSYSNPMIQTFDSDSYPIGIDSHASACMSPEEGDFIASTLQPIQSVVRPFQKGSDLKIEKKGTLKWLIEDDKGNIHKIVIPNSLLVPDGRQRLLSPQHWAKEQNKINCKRDLNLDAVCSIQFHNRNELRWGESSEIRNTVQNYTRSNVPIFYSASGTLSYASFMANTSTTTTCMENEGLQQCQCYPATTPVIDNQPATSVTTRVTK